MIVPFLMEVNRLGSSFLRFDRLSRIVETGPAEIVVTVGCDTGVYG